MSDTHRRYRAIQQALMSCFGYPTGHRTRHLHTLVALICGIVGSQHTQLPKVANQAPGFGAIEESQVMRFRRWLQNEAINYQTWMLPVAQALLAALAHQPILLVMDGSTVGRGCLTLMMSVIYQRRALPLAWVVVKGKRGHFPQEMHCALLAQVQAIMPPGATVVFLGDGEFDGTEPWPDGQDRLQAAIAQLGWPYVCRTASNILVTAFERPFAVGDLPVQPGEGLVVSPAAVTAEQYGPVNVLAVWEKGYAEPLYLVTNMDDPAAALAYYRKRAHIETFFSDQKSRGFRLDHSHLSDPVRLSRLLFAACLAYIWVVYLGVCARRDGWLGRLHRRKRCDLSLFQLGLRLLNYCLKEGLRIPSGLLVQATFPKLAASTN